MTFRFSILPVLLFIALLALVAVYWGEGEPDGVRVDGLPLQTVTEEPGQLQDAGPPQVPGPPQDVGPIVNDDGSEVREREQVGEAAQRLIQVLGVNGAAAAGADLEYAIYPLEIASKPFFQEWLQDPSLLGNVQFLADALSAKSDADGIARISEEGVGIAIASLPGLRGGVAFGPWGAASDDTIVVQLHPYADFEVRVVDHAGRPAEGVSVSVQSAKVDGIPIAEQMWSSVGRSGHATDVDGRVKRSTDFTSNQMKAQGLDQPGVALRVSARLPMNGMVVHPVQFKQKEAVTLQLPPLGGARIQLTGYPNHIVPRLVDPTPNPAQEFPRRGSMDAKQERDSEGRFVFERIPLGREFEVRFMRQSATDRGGFTTQSSSIAAEVLAGPVVEGEVVEASFKMEAEQRIVGRLIDEKGEPIKWLRNAGFYCTLLARTAEPNAMPIRMTFELDEDGQFFARTPGPDPRVEGSRKVELHELSELLFMRQSGDPNRYLGLGPEPSWRRLQVSIPAGEQSHDLGDVQLGHDDANLTVTVLSPEGNPVPRARLQFERKVRMHRNGEEKWYDFAGDLGQEVVTSDTGRFVLVSFDSRYALMSIFGLDNEHASVLDECRVKVGQSSYQRGTYEFSAQDRELTVTLEKAYPLSGQVQIPANLGRLQLEVRPTNSLGKGGTFVQSLHFSRGKQQADGSFIVPFQIKQLANTPYSLEFSTGESESKYFRLESINPAETPELAEVIDLRPHIDWLELAIVDTEGRPLGQADQSTYQFFLREFHGSGGSHGTGVTWQNEFIVVPKPQGERFNGAIQVKGFRSMPLGELAAGRHTLKLSGMREARFRYALDRQIPYGTRIHTDWFWLTGLDDPVERDASADPNADVIMRMGIGGTFMLTWEWLDANGNRMNSKRERYTVKESELASGEVIELKVPDGLFE